MAVDTIEIPSYVTEEHLVFLNKSVKSSSRTGEFKTPFSKLVADQFGLPVAESRRIVNFWFKTLDDEEK